MEDFNINKTIKEEKFSDFDNLTVSGVNQFETLLKLALKCGIVNTMTEAIQNGKRYFKTNYKMHCNTTNYCKPETYSLLFALSDVNKTSLGFVFLLPIVSTQLKPFNCTYTHVKKVSTILLSHTVKMVYFSKILFYSFFIWFFILIHLHFKL